MQKRSAYAVSRAEALDYLQDHVRELCALASARNLETITYLLEMAYLEISDTVRGERPYAELRRLPERAVK